MIEKLAPKILEALQAGSGYPILEMLRPSHVVARASDYKPPVYIPKRSGGKRKIQEPKQYLKDIQRWIVTLIKRSGYGPSPYAHGFVKDRSRRTNAEPHIGHIGMLKMDIEDFFGSCTPGLVDESLRRLEPPDWILLLVSRLCFLDDGLPQGSPASPILSNIVAREMDFRIAGLCKSFMHERRKGAEITYTRYADDMTFTSNWAYLKELRHPVKHILADYDFRVKHSKTKFFYKPARLESCGVVISQEKINAKRRDRLYWRGRLHKMVVDIKRNGVPPGRYRRHDGRIDRISNIMLAKIQGKIASITDISRQDRKRLFSKFEELKALCRG